MAIQERHHVNFFGGGFVKSWTYHGKYSDLSEGATKIK